ncbi:DUF2299 family protein [Candidatus Palauibacter sp.]|uniref:DUF2299 family protein n=1 Tax=Candidatus Palauibacter sp. TaxID=3101350 RepID=UPI003B01B1BC
MLSPSLEQVREWAETLLLRTEVVDVDDPAELAWGLTLKPPHEGGIHVFVGNFVRDAADHVIAQARIGVSDQHIAAITGLSEHSRRLFFLDLQLGLSQPPLEIGVEVRPNDDTGLQVVVDFSMQLIDENISKANLYDSFVRFQNAFHTLQSFLNKLAVLRSWP